jgi:hypothetical protein
MPNVRRPTGAKWRRSIVQAGHRSAPNSASANTACADILYKIPLATYHAYNSTGGGCFCFAPPRAIRREAASRCAGPGSGIGGDTDGDYCTDFDLHDDPARLYAHRLLLNVGHDEYRRTPLPLHLAVVTGTGGVVAVGVGLSLLDVARALDRHRIGRLCRVRALIALVRQLHPRIAVAAPGPAAFG